MSNIELEDEFVRPPDAGPLLERASAPWLDVTRDRLARMRSQGRLPHGVLLTGAVGSGQAELATWLAALLLCRSADAPPCGRCGDCKLLLAGNHPDFRWVSVLEDKKEISIDQMRVLSAALAMRSYRGGVKVAVITPLEAMSLKAHNALLKTLEEPAAETYLVLAANRIDRIPKTVLSRCTRLPIPAPDEAAALAWLDGRAKSPAWRPLLALAGGAPFLALEYEEAGLGGLEADMQDAMAAAGEGRLDFVAFAAHCAKNAPLARLAWLESWLTRSLKDDALAGDLVNNKRVPWLRPPGRATKIRAGFGLLDELRRARRDAGGSLNMQLLFEGLAVSLAALVGPLSGSSRGTMG